MDSRFDAFDPLATFDDGRCPPVLPGCMQPNASNYRALATVEDGSCLYQGCIDSNAINHDPSATLPGECVGVVFGCLDSAAENFFGCNVSIAERGSDNNQSTARAGPPAPPPPADGALLDHVYPPEGDALTMSTHGGGGSSDDFHLKQTLPFTEFIRQADAAWLSSGNVTSGSGGGQPHDEPFDFRPPAYRPVMAGAAFDSEWAEETALAQIALLLLNMGGEKLSAVLNHAVPVLLLGKGWGSSFTAVFNSVCAIVRGSETCSGHLGGDNYGLGDHTAASIVPSPVVAVTSPAGPSQSAIPEPPPPKAATQRVLVSRYMVSEAIKELPRGAAEDAQEHVRLARDDTMDRGLATYLFSKLPPGGLREAWRARLDIQFEPSRLDTVQLGLTRGLRGGGKTNAAAAGSSSTPESRPKRQRQRAAFDAGVAAEAEARGAATPD